MLLSSFLGTAFSSRVFIGVKVDEELLQEEMVAKNYYLNKSAKDAYRSYILAYNSHSMKDIFNVHRLDLQVLLASNGLTLGLRTCYPTITATKRVIALF